MSIATLFGMANVSDVTESLLARTKRLLDERGELSLREIAEAIDVSHDWLKSFACGRAGNPGILRLEALHTYLVEYHAAKRFQERTEARAS